MTYMLDTNICIYIMKQKSDTVLRHFWENVEAGICISSITLAELEYGMQHSSNPVKNRRALFCFLAPIGIRSFGTAAACTYGVIRESLQRRGTPIDPLDMLIAAHALSEEQTLITNNVREFARIPELKIENWA